MPGGMVPPPMGVNGTQGVPPMVPGPVPPHFRGIMPPYVSFFFKQFLNTAVLASHIHYSIVCATYDSQVPVKGVEGGILLTSLQPEASLGKST